MYRGINRKTETYKETGIEKEFDMKIIKHTDFYIYISRRIDIVLIKLPRLENSANTYMWHTEQWTAVSTYKETGIEKEFDMKIIKHTDFYIYISRRIDIVLIKLPRLENSANTYMWHTEQWTAVSTFLGLISSDLHHGEHNDDLGRLCPKGGRVLYPEKRSFKTH